MPGRDPLLPKWVTTTIAIVVTLGWLASVVAAVLDRDNAATLLPVTGVLTMVISACFGIGFRGAQPRNEDRTEDKS